MVDINWNKELIIIIKKSNENDKKNFYRQILLYAIIICPKSRNTMIWKVPNGDSNDVLGCGLK